MSTGKIYHWKHAPGLRIQAVERDEAGKRTRMVRIAGRISSEFWLADRDREAWWRLEGGE